MHERRKAPRYSLGVEGTVNPPTGGAGTKVSVSVISTLGCSIECADRAQIGKKCELYFNWQDLQLGLQAQVVWKSAGGYGLRFYSVDEETQQRLNDLCKALLIKPPAATQAILEESATPAGKPSAAAGVRPDPPTHPSLVESISARPAIRENERRKVPRYVSELHAQLNDPATGESLNVSLVTLSVLGGCLEGRSFPGVGADCHLHAEWEGQRLAIEGEVVWKSNDQAGVRFRALAEGPEKLLRQICSSLRLQPLAPMPNQPK
jgi:PilZ domain-containing protein